jgi:Bacterial TSP3 repeat
MRFLYFISLITALASSALAQYAAQDTPCITATSSPGVYTLTYPSVAGRVYFLQISTDLQTWNYCPVVQLGDGSVQPEAWLLCSNSSRVFARLEYSLADTFTDGDTSDIDGDGLTNLAEITTHQTQPGNADTDGDGLTDGAEINSWLSDPLKFDLPEITVVTAWRKSWITDAMRRPVTGASTRTASAVGTGDGTSTGSRTNYYTWTNLAPPSATATGFPLTTASASSTNWLQGRNASGSAVLPIPTLNDPLAVLTDNEVPAAWRLERLHGTSSEFIATTNTNIEKYRNINATATILERIVRLKSSRVMPKDWRVYYKAHNAVQYDRDGVWAVIPGALDSLLIPENTDLSNEITLSITAAATTELPGRTRSNFAAPWVNKQVYETRAIKWIEWTGRPAVPVSGDSDGDGITDAVEPRLGLSPSALDSNGDGVSDGDALMPSLFTVKTMSYSEREVEYAWLADDPECPGHPAKRIEVRPLNVGAAGLEDPMAAAVGLGSSLQSKIDALGVFASVPPAINIPCIPSAEQNAVINNGFSATMNYSKASSGPVSESAQGNQMRVWGVMNPAPTVATTINYLKLSEVSGSAVTASLVPFNFANGQSSSSNWVEIKAPLPSGSTGSPSKTVKETLIRIDIEPDANMAGVVGDAVNSVVAGSTIKHFVSTKKSAELAQDYVILKATGITAAQITPGHASQIVEWVGGEAMVPADHLKRRVRRDTAAKNEVNIRIKNGGAAVKQMIVWVVWSQGATSATFPVAAVTTPAGITIISGGYQFVFSITPSSITDPSVTERPDLTGPNTHNGATIHPPGAEEPHILNNTTFLKHGATSKWDVTRRMRVKILNPNLLPRDTFGPLGKPMWDGQPAVALTRIEYPDPANPPPAVNNACKGNDDSDVAGDEDNNPYQVSAKLKCEHHISQIASFDQPTLALFPQHGAQNNTFEWRLQFGEFSRLLIGGGWYRTSDYFPWRMHIKFIKGADTWSNNNSILELNNNGW